MRIIGKQVLKGLMVSIIVCSSAFIQAQTINEVIEAFNGGAELVNGGAFEEAILKFEECIELATQLGTEGDEMKNNAQAQIPTLHYRLAMDLYKAKDIDGAILKFEDAVVACDKYGNDDVKSKSEKYIPQLYNVKGNTHLKNEEFEDAISSFDKAIEGIPNYTRAYYGKGMVYRKTKEEDKMIEMFDKTIEIAQSPGDDKYIDAVSKIMRNLYRDKAAVAFNAEDYPTVFEMANKSLEYDSEFSDPYYYMSRIYNKDLEYNKALENAQKALDFETDEERKPRIWFELGNAYVGLVEYEKACEAFGNCLVEPFESSVRHKMENVLNCQ